MTTDREIRLQIELLETQRLLDQVTTQLQVTLRELQIERMRYASLLAEAESILRDESTRPAQKARENNRRRGLKAREVVARMTKEKKSAAEIAEALQVTTTRVYQIRSELRRAKSPK